MCVCAVHVNHRPPVGDESFSKRVASAIMGYRWGDIVWCVLLDSVNLAQFACSVRRVCVFPTQKRVQRGPSLYIIFLRTDFYIYILNLKCIL